MWDVSSTLGVLTTVFNSTGTILFLSIGGIVTGLVALLGLGFGVNKTREWIYDGKHFGTGPTGDMMPDGRKVDWDRLDRMNS